MSSSFFFFNNHYNSIIGEFFRATRSFLRIVKLTLPAQQANSFAGLSSILGQYGINSNDFINDFDRKTCLFEVGFNVRLNLLLLMDRKFTIVLKKISSSEMLLNFSSILNRDFNIRKLSRLNLYKIFLIKSDYSHLEFVSIFNTIFGTLRSFGKLRLI